MTEVTASHPEWNDQISAAEEMIPIIGRMFRNKSVEFTIFGKSLLNKSAIELIKIHRYARHLTDSELPLLETLGRIRQIEADAPEACIIDLGLIAQDVSAASNASSGLAQVSTSSKAHDVVLYGFGRIGRYVARILLDRSGSETGLQLRAIVVRKGSETDLIKRASLLRRDSVHGKFNGVIQANIEDSTIVANGHTIRVIYASDPSEIDYRQFGIEGALVIDNTGKWRDQAGLTQHLEAKGVARVLLTAPGKSPLKNVVFGINEKEIKSHDLIASAASCTTNAITPVLKVMNDEFGIVHGHVETVHSYTNDQNLIDNFHKGDRRGRAAGLNMVITETGAAQAVTKALPELQGRLTGNAIRVPTPNVSMAILNLELSKDTNKEEVNRVLRAASLQGALRDQIDYIESPEVVSSDFIGNVGTGIVDGLATIAGHKRVVLYVWYDNEAGYSHQVVRVAQRISSLIRS